jgi:hypothetical protein
MKALALTTLTLLFLAMAASTYLSVRRDPLAGEPHYDLLIDPPPGKQAVASPPASVAPPDAATDASKTSPRSVNSPDATAATVPNEPDAPPVIANPDRVPAQTTATKNGKAQPAPADAESDGGSAGAVSVTIPQ